MDVYLLFDLQQIFFIIDDFLIKVTDDVNNIN
jgi:hypothetical protein